MEHLWGSSRPLGRDVAPHIQHPEPSANSNKVFERVRSLPHMFPILELHFDFGTLCCIRLLLEVLLLPLKPILSPKGCNRRDWITVYLVSAGLLPYLLVTSNDAPMYLYSYWYHFVRGTSMLKIYVIFGMLEVAEQLLASFNHDLSEALWVAVQRCARKKGVEEGQGQSLFTIGWIGLLAGCGCAAETFTLLMSIVTLNAALNSDDYSIFALLIANNFKEIKSAVFKKTSLEYLFQQASLDILERVQLAVFCVVMLLRHAQSDGFGTVQSADLLVIFVSEMVVDYAKHLFIARFNSIDFKVYYSFYQLLLWDAARTFWKSNLIDQCILGAWPPAASKQSPPPYLSKRQQQYVSDILGAPTLIPNPCRRLGFTPYAPASLLIWATWNLVVGCRSWVTVGVAILLVLMVQSLIATFVDGTTARFVVKAGRWEKLGRAATERRLAVQDSPQVRQGVAGHSQQQRHDYDECATPPLAHSLGCTSQTTAVPWPPLHLEEELWGKERLPMRLEGVYPFQIAENDPAKPSRATTSVAT